VLICVQLTYVECVFAYRYIICQGKRSDSEPVQQYLFLLNERMCQIWPGVSHSNIDIQEVVPYEILQQDEPFFQYIYNSNVKYVAFIAWLSYISSEHIESVNFLIN